MEIFFNLLVSVSLFWYLLSCVFTVFYSFKRKFPDLKNAKLPRVTILKPVKNTDHEMEINFESFYRLNYPDYEIVFGLDECEEECYGLIDSISRKYPSIPTRIIVKKTSGGLNPKIEVLSMIEPGCKSELLWVTDSNVRVQKDTLLNLVREYLRTNAKLVFSPFIGTGSKTFASVMENSYINLYVSGSIITCWKLARQHIIVGKSMLIEKAALDKFGGFGYFGKYLAEDYMMGEIYVENKVPISTNYIWVTNYNCYSTVKSFIARAVRWAKLRFHIKPAHYFCEIITFPVGLALLSSIFTGYSGLKLAAIAASVKVFFEYFNLFFVNTEDRKKLWIIVLFPVLVLFKDILTFVIVYFAPYISNRTKWRGRTITIGRKSVIAV